MDVRKFTYVLQDISSLGPLPCSHFTSSADHSKQWAGHWLLLTCYFFGVFGYFKLTAPAQMPQWPSSLPHPTCTRLGYLRIRPCLVQKTWFLAWFGVLKSDLRCERPDLGIKGPDLWFEGPDLGSERPGLRLGGIQLKPDLTDPLQLNPVITDVKGPTNFIH